MKITGCHFSGGNDGPGQHKGIIAIFADEAGSGANHVVHRNTSIAGNTFNDNRSPAIYVGSAEDIQEIAAYRVTARGSFTLTNAGID